MGIFRLDDFPDPEPGDGFLDDIPYPLNTAVTGTVAYVKADEAKQRFSLKIVQQVNPTQQYAVWHNLNFGNGDTGARISKQQLVAAFGDPNLVPTDYDEIAEKLKGVEISFKAVANGDFINVKSYKVTKSVAQLKGSDDFSSVTAPVAPVPAPVAPQGAVTAVGAVTPSGGDPF